MVFHCFRKNSHKWEFFLDKLVLIGHTIFATGHLRHFVTTIDKSIAMRANDYDYMDEKSDEIRHKTTVLVEIWRT
jgi:hypothetical protein